VVELAQIAGPVKALQVLLQIGGDGVQACMHARIVTKR
jgi:hypothetical protein